MEEITCFFYGTLMSRKILLHGYKRRKVHGAPYPAIIKDENSDTHGIVVKGLTPEDMLRLDFFEGDQYAKIEVQVFFTNNEDYKDNKDYKYENAILAQTYVWIDSVELLEDKEWDHKDFEENIKDKLLLNEDPEEVSDFFG
ncbi:11268_t:CDS:2 [Diversispora eburnea]|uniref:Putative gamma-glutamylcyclotransferase n=1 Tax=Diversispora eburnea TaxID=1213867 RepID=A0A9N8VWT6_9GLOM|nr:11268_t:CDS:2 [Diversispora eburnea]